MPATSATAALRLRGVRKTFLPEKASPLATLIYKDHKGQEQRVQARLTGRC